MADEKETGSEKYPPHVTEGGNVAGSPASETDEDAIDEKAQAGVQNMEATTKVWSKQHLILAYIMIWCVYFIDSMQQGATGALTPYVTSSFNQHSLTATTGVLSQLIGGLSKLTLAKILDIWGRPQGYAICVLILTMGIVMMAACQNVETYAAAQVLYWVGYVFTPSTLFAFAAVSHASILLTV
jgi:MFS family permease